MTDAGFVKAQSDNLPKVDSIMVAEFFANSNSFSGTEMRGVKLNKAGREDYGDSAIGYVQVRREGELCTIKGKICPEHKIKSKNYNLEMVVNEVEEKVLDVKCMDCAAAAGGCKHAVAFIMWMHRRSEEPSPTETECYWRKSTLAHVGTQKKFITVAELGETSGGDMPNIASENFLDEFVEIASKKKLNCQLLKHFKPDTRNTLSLHNLIYAFNEMGGELYEDFLIFSKGKMTSELCQEACNATLNQSKSKLWHELHYGRFTASRIFEASTCKTVAGSFVDSVMGGSINYESKAMIRGKNLEKSVITELEKKIKSNLSFTGLLLSGEYPYLGASPDAICNEYVVEVKCPVSEKTFSNYIKNGKITNKFNAQIQLQMLFFKKTKGIFCVADPSFEVNKKISIIYVNYDEQFIKDIINKAEKFWKENIFPILLNSVR